MKTPTLASHIDRPLIYVADDDPSLRLPMSEILTAEGFEVEVFEGPAALLERCKSRLPDLLLLDVDMPGCNGFVVCSYLRADPRSALLPIIMITGHDDGASIHQAYVAGATDFMAKPVNWPLLGYRVRYALRTAKSNLDLIARENENRALLEAIPDAILVVHRDGSIVEELRGMEGNAELSRKIAADLSDISQGFQDFGLLASVRRVALRQHLETLELHVEQQDGETQIFELRCSPLNEEEVLLIARNISERKAAEIRIHRLAYFDPLTGLPNREKFQEDLDRKLVTVDGLPAQVAALYLDLDRFKRINDTFGHAIGDGLLRATAERLSRICRNDDACSVARLGGDEFAVLVEGVADAERLVVIATRILEAFTEPMASAGHEFVMTPSIGIAQFPQHAGDSVTLLKNADTAMYAAKAQGRNNYAIYQPAMNARSAAAIELENLLRKAIERDEIHVAYQPKRRTSDGELVGVEALARWYDPDRGLIPASQFIPIAEDTGLISRVGRAVLQQVVRQISLWHQSGRKAVPVAVNICAVEFGRGEVAAFVKELLDLYELPAKLLQFEITEGVLLLGTPTVTSSIAALRNLGCRIAIDDFGTGYSSLSYLQNLQIDALKIDQSFVRRLPDEEAAAAICRAVIELAKGLKLEVVAEGVETESQLEFLRRCGCDTIQGYLVGRPMPADQLEQLLELQAPGREQVKRA